jgi:hypothetical protein
MESIGDLEHKVQKDTEVLLSKLREALEHHPNSVDEAVSLILELRKHCYEDLNQIPHEYLCLQARSWLTRAHIVPASATWQWNPRQTGGADLQARVDGTVVLSAEVSASEKPDGGIGEGMVKALKKLRKMPGLHYYIVRNAQMCEAAERFAFKACPDARVIVINFDTLCKRHLVVPLKAVQDVDLPHPAEPDLAGETEGPG